MSGPITMQIQQVEHPSEGRKSGSIKLADGSYMKVRAKEMWKVNEGKTYNIEWEDSEFNGKTYRWLTKATPVDGSNGGAKAAPGKPQTYTRPETAAADSERIWVAGCMNNAIHGGQVDIRDLAGMVETARLFREVYRRTFMSPQHSDDMNDQIPF